MLTMPQKTQPKSPRPEFLEPAPAKTALYEIACAKAYEIASLYQQADFLEHLLHSLTRNIGLSAKDVVRYSDAETALDLIYERLEELTD